MKKRPKKQLQKTSKIMNLEMKFLVGLNFQKIVIINCQLIVICDKKLMLKVKIFAIKHLIGPDFGVGKH